MPRKALRPMPAGQSLKIPSPLRSSDTRVPRMTYPEPALTMPDTWRSYGNATEPLATSVWRWSFDVGPQSGPMSN